MRRLYLLLSAVAGLAAAGCGTNDVEVLCGTSFKAPMEKLVEMYRSETGENVVLVFGGSEDHLPRVELKAAGDVFVTHAPYMKRTERAGSLLREVPVGFLAPVLVVSKGNPKKVQSIEDLANDGVSVVLTHPEYSTCGEMVFKLLEDKGIKDAVLKNVGNDQVRDHATVGNHLKLGARDAGIMWNGVARGFADDIEIVNVPYEYDEEIGVSVMGLSYTKKKARVEKFLDFVETNGPDVFAQFGYTK